MAIQAADGVQDVVKPTLQHVPHERHLRDKALGEILSVCPKRPNRSAKRSPRRKRHAAQYTNVLFEGTFKRPTWSLKTKWNLAFKRIKSEIRSHIALQVAPSGNESPTCQPRYLRPFAPSEV